VESIITRTFGKKRVEHQKGERSKQDETEEPGTYTTPETDKGGAEKTEKGADV